MSSLRPSPEGGGPEGAGGGVPKLVFSLEKALETLSQVVPSASEEVESIKGLLRQVLMKATQGGGAARPSRPGMQTAAGGMGGAPNY